MLRTWGLSWCCIVVGAHAFLSPKQIVWKAQDHVIGSSLNMAALEPPALTVDGLSCSHDGGDTWQLQDVSYILPRGASTFGEAVGSILAHTL